MIDPYRLLCRLPIDGGELWGNAAEPWQRTDARAFLADTGPRRHDWLRGRGMSKTGDAVGLILALMLAGRAPVGGHGHWYAADHDQTVFAMDAARGYLARMPALGDELELQARAIIHRPTGASVTLEAADAVSAYGQRPWLLVADELGMWPNRGKHADLWGAIVSAMPKVPGSRLLAIGTGGSPDSIGARLWGTATASDHWHTSRNPGPPPWWTPEDVEALRGDLTPSEWARLVECAFVLGDDTLTTEADIDACTRATGTLPPMPGARYIATLDLGVRRDYSALTIAHVSQLARGRVAIVDRVLLWKPPRGGRVDLSDVEAGALAACREYRVSALHYDPNQAEMLTQRLERAGVPCIPYLFGASGGGTGAARLARGLANALRDRTVELPADPELRRQLATVRLVEGASGNVKMQNPAGEHDDAAVTVAMAAVLLLAEAESMARLGDPVDSARRLGLAAPSRVGGSLAANYPGSGYRR